MAAVSSSGFFGFFLTISSSVGLWMGLERALLDLRSRVSEWRNGFHAEFCAVRRNSDLQKILAEFYQDFLPVLRIDLLELLLYLRFHLAPWLGGRVLLLLAPYSSLLTVFPKE